MATPAEERSDETPQEEHWPKLARPSSCDEASAAMQEHILFCDEEAQRFVRGKRPLGVEDPI